MARSQNGLEEGLVANVVLPATGLVAQDHLRVAGASGGGGRATWLTVTPLPDFRMCKVTRAVARGVRRGWVRR